MSIIDYNDPNDVWRMTGYDPYKGMTDDERMKAGCLQVIAFIALIVVLFLVMAFFSW